MPSIFSRFQSGWNAFLGRDPTGATNFVDYGSGSSYRPDRGRILRSNNDRTIISSVINRIAIDSSQIDIKHVRLEDEKYVETINSDLNYTLTQEANVDQTGRAFIQDVVTSMCDEGVVAIVPTDTSTNPKNGAFKIYELRCGRITEWFPRSVKVELYNEREGKREIIMLPKSMVAIVENPLYAVMNEPNSTLQRLKRTLSNLDVFDSRNASGKLDLIIQLPYVVKGETRKSQAEARRKEVEMQLTGSKYGIAYTDGTERITQLNRSVENNYWSQAKELTSMLYNQLGLTEAVFDGTADERAMANYYNRTIKPILQAITEEMQRKFLTKTARSQGQAIKFFRDPFELVTASDFAEIAGKLKTSEIASTNEMRAVIGWKPSDDQKANELRNANINQADVGVPGGPEAEGLPPNESEDQTEVQEPTNENLSPEEVDNLIKMLQDELRELEAIKANNGESEEEE